MKYVVAILFLWFVSPCLASTVNVTTVNAGSVNQQIAPWQFSTDFSGGLPFTHSPNWGVSGGFATNAPTSWEMVTDPTFQATSNWVGNATATINVGSAGLTNVNSGTFPIVSSAADSVYMGQYNHWQRLEIVVDYFSSAGTLSYYAMGIGDAYAMPAISYAKTWGSPYLDISRDSFIPHFQGFAYPPGGTGVVSKLSFHQIDDSQVVAVTNTLQSDHYASCRIATMPTNAAAGVVVRQRFLNRVCVVGDSKTANIDWSVKLWPTILTNEVYFGFNGITPISKDSYAFPGYTFSDIYSLLQSRTPLGSPCDVAFIDLGVNNNGSSYSTCLTGCSNVVSTLKANFPDIKCYLANVWGRDAPWGSLRDTTNANLAIDAVISNNPSWCFHGPDERILLSVNNGTNYTVDGLHPNDDGYNLIADGFSTNANLSLSGGTHAQDAIFVYYNTGMGKVQAIASVHGTNTLLLNQTVSYVSNAIIGASCNSTNLKVFYDGTQVGSYIPLTWPRLDANTSVGLFATHTNTQFSFFSVSNSTSSLTLP